MRKTGSQLDREIRQALHPGSGSASSGGFADAEIAQMFRKRGASSDSAKVAVLGDPMYVRRFKMPKWNIMPSVLDSADVAIRHHNELGISTSKHAHALRADYFRDMQDRFRAEHRRLVDDAERRYGAHGAVVSGGMHEDWPGVVKDRIRFVAQGSSTLGAACKLHEALSKTRSPAFR